METFIYEVLTGNLAFAGCRLSYTYLREFCMRPVDWQYAAATPKRGNRAYMPILSYLFFFSTRIPRIVLLEVV